MFVCINHVRSCVYSLILVHSARSDRLPMGFDQDLVIRSIPLEGHSGGSSGVASDFYFTTPSSTIVHLRFQLPPPPPVSSSSAVPSLIVTVCPPIMHTLVSETLYPSAISAAHFGVLAVDANSSQLFFADCDGIHLYRYRIPSTISTHKAMTLPAGATTARSTTGAAIDAAVSGGRLYRLSDDNEEI